MDRGSGDWRGAIAPFARERRIHARAFAYWQALRGGRAMPLLEEIEPASLSEFVGNSVLIDLAGGGGGAVVAFLGEALRGLADADDDADAAPAGSLLEAIVRRCPEIADGGEPIEFEAELAHGANARLLYRGILLPFADRQGRLAAVYGVMNWREAAALTDPVVGLAVETALSLRLPPPPRQPWQAPDGAALPPLALPPRSDRRATARTWAALAVGDRTRGTAGINRALGAAHDLLLTLRADEDCLACHQDEAAIVADLFDAAPAEDQVLFAAVLRRATRLGLGGGRLAETLDRYEGGYRAFAAAGADAATVAEAPAAGLGAWRPIDPAFLRGIGLRTMAEVPPELRDSPAAKIPLARRAAG